MSLDEKESGVTWQLKVSKGHLGALGKESEGGGQVWRVEAAFPIPDWGRGGGVVGGGGKRMTGGGCGWKLPHYAEDAQSKT